MGKYTIKQYRYYKDGSKLNQPQRLTAAELVSGRYFANQTIASLGIQTIPGIKFRLNNSPEDSIIIGPSGIYELNILDNYEINGLNFFEDNLKALIDNSGSSAYLIIDVVQNAEE